MAIGRRLSTTWVPVALATLLACACGRAQTRAPTWPSPADDPCIPTPPGSQAVCEPQPLRTPRWRPGCGPGAPADDEIEIELRHTGSMPCLGGHVIATGARAAAWTAGRQDVCIVASSSDRWGPMDRGTIVYVIPVGGDAARLEAQMTCARRPPEHDVGHPPASADDPPM